MLKEDISDIRRGDDTALYKQSHTYLPHTQQKQYLRSPLFYVGDKFKLMPQLLGLFPNDIHTYIEPFCGGGSSFLNVKAGQYQLNDIDTNIINLHRFLSRQNMQILDEIFHLIKSYNLSCSLQNIIPPISLRQAFKKTYFARFNKDSYMRLREDFNANKSDFLRLYLLLIYGFNRFLRFNAKGEFNLPVGNVDFNANVFNALKDYFNFMQDKNITFSSLDFREFIQTMTYKKDDFIYLDPPYLISDSEYNKLWNEREEQSLYEMLHLLNAKGVRFGLSNVLTHKGKKNVFLEAFMRDYQTHIIKSNYISFNDNSIKKDTLEVFVRNF